MESLSAPGSQYYQSYGDSGYQVGGGGSYYLASFDTVAQTLAHQIDNWVAAFRDVNGNPVPDLDGDGDHDLTDFKNDLNNRADSLRAGYISDFVNNTPNASGNDLLNMFLTNSFQTTAGIIDLLVPWVDAYEGDTNHP